MAGPALAPFAPNVAGSVTITVTDSSAATAFTGNGKQFMVHNAGSAIVFFNTGTSAATAATTTGTPVPVGAIMVFTKKITDTHIATISGTTGQTLYVTTGEGE